MLYNVRQSYTPALELNEFTERSLIIDTETVGKGAEVEVVEIALGDCEGKIVFHSLVRPAFNRLPRSRKEQRFDSSEFEGASYWDEVWENVAPLVDNKLLIAYNASFDCRALAAECARHHQRSNELGLAVRHATREEGSRHEEESHTLGGVLALRVRSRQPQGGP